MGDSVARPGEVAAVAPPPPQGRRRGSPWARAVRHPTSLFLEPPYPGVSPLVLLLAVGVWEGATRALGVKVVLLPPPSLVATALWEYGWSGEMVVDLAATLRRLLIGLGLGTVAGIVVGLLIGWYGIVRAALSPLVAVTFPVPKVALVPLFIIWFGMGDTYKVVLVMVAVFYVVLTNTIAGVRGIPRVTIMACQNLGANDRQIFWKVALPAALPVVLAGFRIAFSLAMVLVIAAEMIVSREGLGRFIAMSGLLLQTERVFAGLTLAGVTGLIGYQVIDWGERRLIRWRTGRHLDQL